ncbi:hypothetical protein AXG93_2415s1410 [Marchantia polymorpha subsp. ruderalis]|uniref:Protein kinase domain-containing protein n=1 Tax=Marchantia polymorpha subsp. ruderalis TaxID=1480154 RepID=A0A176VW18_MARPO|nr:hypothetical protein AXG93_2415s1410 [Marchantia polymorpha subsp. ruderalis]
MNKDLASEAPTRGTHKENLLGTTTIDETRKASRKGGRPASKSPLPLDTGCSANGKAHENVHNKFSKASAKVSQIDSQEEATHSSKPVKETHHALRYEDPEGNKMINEYVRDCKIGTGSYGKVVLHRSRKDDKLYAIKIFHKSRLRKLRVAPAETALMDVLREVSIMKKLDHPNIVKLVEVIDDPESDYFYMGVTYRGRAADVWALGCTLYCMVLGRYPFVGDTLQGTYERIVNDQFWFPGDMDPDLLSLLRGLLCKDIILRRSYKLCLLHPETDSPDMRVYEVNNVDSPTVKRSIFDLLLRLATSRSTFLRFWPSGAVDK